MKGDRKGRTVKQNKAVKSKGNPSFSSPTSAVSAEETRILTEHISQQNLFKLIHLYEPHRKTLILKKFFKMKRNQEVVITTVIEEEARILEGKVSAIGRDFVMLTNLQRRIWLPFTSIESATIPFGTPTYSNPHQHHIYDNQLRQKLVLQFGETVTKRDALIQQFFEESIRTNLHSWKGSWVEVKTASQSHFGKIIKTDETSLYLQLVKTESIIPLHEIQLVATVRIFSLWKEVLKLIF
ncbi:hypothetical protein [Ornithinibacillus californiensis]|uniref:hypothetical protein n=1 Tax=Ornithinibacillus californiensis TaxID=161536 RepID=UPI00064DEADD|nr:hypothetical protein [Ornithinibacillus californiensis]